MDSEDKIVVSVIKLFPAFGQYATKSSVLLCKQFFFYLADVIRITEYQILRGLSVKVFSIHKLCIVHMNEDG